jgi:ribosomal protein S18 acetylase RimI-like enzyme
MRPPHPKISVREVVVDDLIEISRIHKEAFPRGALTTLGSEAVRRYYDWQMNGPHDAYNIVVLEGSVVRGFCFSGVFRGALRGYLEKNRMFLAVCVLSRPWLVLSPVVVNRLKLAGRILAKRPTRTNRSDRPQPQKALPPKKSFGILSIAIDSTSRGRGLADALMLEAESEAIRRENEWMHLSVSSSNRRAIRFYEKMGWSLSKEGSDGSVRMEKYLEVGGGSL